MGVVVVVCEEQKPKDSMLIFIMLDVSGRDLAREFKKGILIVVVAR